MRKQKLILLAAASVLLAAFSSCSGEDDVVRPAVEQTTEAVTEATTVPEITPAETTTTEPAKVYGAANPLTGEWGYNEDAIGKRPIALMINNYEGALPQYGISKADYMYELVVEGGITRMMAVFADYTNIPDVCSVRSCRYYYPIIAYGLDAIYCHWGADTTIATETLERLGIDRFDGYYCTMLFQNDEERLQYYDREHTGYFIGSRVPEAMDEYGFRKERNCGDKEEFNFPEKDDIFKPEGTPCTNPDVIFSQGYHSTFTYDPETNTYLKQHNGNPHMDSHGDIQLAYTNVFVLLTNINYRGVGELMDVDIMSGGSGYYITDGVAQEISWSRPSEESNFVFTDKNGQPLTVNRGKCYFGITDNVNLG